MVTEELMQDQEKNQKTITDNAKKCYHICQVIAKEVKKSILLL